MKKLLYYVIDYLNIDSIIGTYFRKSKSLVRLIPPYEFYSGDRRKRIKINGVKFIIEPRDLVQHILLKPDVLNTEDYGLKYLMCCLEKYKDSNVVVFDIGSNCGQFSLLGSDEIEDRFPNMKVSFHAFEPNPFVFKRLTQNYKLNQHLESNIKFFNKGIGSKEEFLEIQMPLRNSGAGSLLRNYQNEPNEVHLVEIIRLDEHVRSQEIKELIVFLKIDVEGFEPMVLTGASELIKSNLPDIYIEMGQGYEKQKFIFNFLREIGYELFADINSELSIVNHENEDSFIRDGGLYNVLARPSDSLKKQCTIRVGDFSEITKFDSEN